MTIFSGYVGHYGTRKWPIAAWPSAAMAAEAPQETVLQRLQRLEAEEAAVSWRQWVLLRQPAPCGSCGLCLEQFLRTCDF